MIASILETKKGRKSADLLSHISKSEIYGITGLSNTNECLSDFFGAPGRSDLSKEMECLDGRLRKKIENRIIELEEANRTLDAFSTFLAHDLRAPLGMLSAYAGILKENSGHKLDEESSMLLDFFVEKTKDMSRLVSNLLALSQVRYALVKEEKVNMDVMVLEIFEEFRLLGTCTNGVEIRLYKLGYCVCNASLMRQVWTNLISNAIKYSQKKSKPIIEIGKIKGLRGSTFYVKDNGAGFEMGGSNKLFHPFQRLHPESEFEGAGIGLALVKTIITRHGGKVWAKSEVGKGAIFYFSIL